MESDNLIWHIFLQLVLISINAFFSATELAIISLNYNKVKRDAQSGDKKSKQILTVLDMPSRFLSTIQTGITFVGFLASALAANSFSPRLAVFINSTSLSKVLPYRVIDSLVLVVITIILAYFTLVFGELVPKRIAMQNSEKIARFSAGFINVLYKILRPIVVLLSMSTNLVLLICRQDTNYEEKLVTEDEIRLLVDVYGEKGLVEASEKEMINNIFEFNNRMAKEVMTPRIDVVAVSINYPYEKIIGIVEDSGLSRFPVYDGDIDNIIGILSSRTLLLEARRNERKALNELLRNPYFVPETVNTDILFRNMQQNNTHIAIVIDEYGGTSGIVTMEDLLEEIVGNIYDEFDKANEKEIIRINENSWRVKGSIGIEELEKELETEIADEEKYETLGGLIFSQLNTIPKDGSKFELYLDGIDIRVEEIADRRIIWAVVTKKAKIEKPEEDIEKNI